MKIEEGASEEDSEGSDYDPGSASEVDADSEVPPFILLMRSCHICEWQ